MTRTLRPVFRTTLLLAAVALASAPLAAQPARQNADARRAAMADALELTPAQRADFDAARQRAATDPASAWSAASDLTSTLSDQQLSLLLEQTATQRSQRADRAGQRRGDAAQRGRQGAQQGRDGARQGRSGQQAERPAARLDDAQRAAIRAIREDARTQAAALRESRDSGKLADDTFRAEQQALRSATQARVLDALPAEMRAAAETRRARRDAARAAREQALGLTAAQRDELAALRADAPRGDRARGDRARGERARGERPTDAEREARRTAGAARADQARSILTDRQRATMAVHRMIAPARGDGARGMGGRGMGPRGGGGPR
jgi:hypothetical protein